MSTIVHIFQQVFISLASFVAILNPYNVPTLPTPTPIPITFPSPTSKPTSTPIIVRPVVNVDPDPPVLCSISKECGGGTIPLKQSECANSVCCQNTPGYYVFYQDRSKGPCANSQKQTNPIAIPTYTNTYVDNYITCIVSYPCTGASNTYRLLPADCTNAQQTATNICNTYYTKPTSAPATKSQADIDACKAAVSAKYKSLISGCYIKYQGSASDACARGYQGQSGSEMAACE